MKQKTINNMECNQLSLLMMDDDQPDRCLYNYLREAFDLVKEHGEMIDAENSIIDIDNIENSIIRYKKITNEDLLNAVYHVLQSLKLDYEDE